MLLPDTEFRLSLRLWDRLLQTTLLWIAACGGGAESARREIVKYSETNPVLQFQLTGSSRIAACAVESDSSLIPSIRCRGEPDRAELARLAALISRSEVSLDPWAAALLDLVSLPGEQRALEQAVTRLEGLTFAPGAPPGIWNDLAVARLGLAAATQDPVILFQAVEALERAGRLDSLDPVVRYNRGLLLARLGLVAAPVSSLSPEEVLEALVRSDSVEILQLVAQNLEPSREAVLNHLLPEWARLKRGNHPGADSLQQRLLRVAQAYSANTGRPFFSGLVDRLILSAADDRVQRDGLIALGEGQAAYRSNFNAAATSRFAEAARWLAGTPLIGWVRFGQGAVAVADESYPDADRAFATALREASPGDLALRGRALWGAALSFARQARLGESLRSYQDAVAAFIEAGEPGSVAAIEFQIASVYRLLGMEDAADRLSYRYLIGTRPHGAFRHLQLATMSQQLFQQGFPLAAALMGAEDVRLPGLTPDERAEGLVRLARALLEAGDSLAAAVRLKEALRAVDSVPSGQRRLRIRAELREVNAELLAEQPEMAITELDSAVAFFQTAGNVISSLPLLVQRTGLRLRMGDTARAERDLVEAARLADKSGSREYSLTRPEAPVFRQLAEIRLARRDTLAAFWLDARARGFRPSDSLRFARSLERIPSSDAVMVFTQERDRLLIWFIRQGKISVRAVQLSEEAAWGLANRFQNVILRRAGADQADPVARAVFDSLLGPELSGESAIQHLVIVASGATYLMPLAAAISSSGERLISRVALSYAGTGLSAVEHLTAPRRPGGAILVANPEFDREAFPGLAPLEQATEEAKEVAAVGRRATTLMGRSATPEAFLEGLARHGVIHFAGHARTAPRAPGGGILVLAPGSDGKAGILAAEEIRQHNLGHLALVVLSSCGGWSPRGGEEAANPIARAFLQAGAREVVSSLWEVDDRSTRELMHEFHGRLAAGVDTPEALRQAQLALARYSANHENLDWSRFRVESR